MWTLAECKRVFFVVALVGTILLLIPGFMVFANSRVGEEFSELYALGSDKTAENYPFNVSAVKSNLMYLVVSNHMGKSMYYGITVKLRNDSDVLPNGTTPSSLPILYEYRIFLEEGQTWGGALNFAFTQVSTSNDSRGYFCNIQSININSAAFEIDKTALWDKTNYGFYYQLLFELWTYNQTNNEMDYAGNFVSIWLNVTA